MQIILPSDNCTFTMSTQYNLLIHISIVLWIFALYISKIQLSKKYILIDNYIFKQFQSNITILSMIINFVVIIFNNGDDKFDHKLIYHYCSWFNFLIMIYLSIMVLESILCIVLQWIKQYCNNLNDKFNENVSQDIGKCKLNKNMHCVAIGCLLMRIMSFICTIHCVYPMINHLLFQQITFLYHLMRITIVLVLYSLILQLYHYHNHVYPLESVSFIVIYISCCLIQSIFIVNHHWHQLQLHLFDY